MSIVQTSQIEMPSDPETLKAIKDAMFEISASKTRAEGEKEFQKEAIAELHEKTKIPKKYLNKMATLYHRQNRSEVEGDMEATGELYDAVFGKDEQQ